MALTYELDMCIRYILDTIVYCVDDLTEAAYGGIYFDWNLCKYRSHSGRKLAASKLVFLQGAETLEVITSTGGLLILGIGINLLELKSIRTGNLLPAIVYAIVGVMIL